MGVTEIGEGVTVTVALGMITVGAGVRLVREALITVKSRGDEGDGGTAVLGY